MAEKYRIRKLERENAELKRQLEIRQKWANTNFEIVLAAEKIIQKLKESYPRQETVKAILSEAVHQLCKPDSYQTVKLFNNRKATFIESEKRIHQFQNSDHGISTTGGAKELNELNESMLYVFENDTHERELKIYTPKESTKTEIILKNKEALQFVQYIINHVLEWK